MANHETTTGPEVDEYIKEHLDKADALLKEGNVSSAHVALRRVLRRDPDSVTARILNAEAELRSRHRAASLRLVNELFEMDPASFDTEQQRRLGSVCFGNELYPKAIQLLEWVGDKNDHDGMSLYQLGVCYRRQGRMDRAERALLDSVKLNPGIAAPHLQLGHVAKATGQLERAADHYRRFIELSQTQKGTGYWCLADLKSYTFSDEEIEAMTREVESGRERPAELSALYFALGAADEKKKNYASALDYYHKANEIQARLKPFSASQYQAIVDGLRDVPGEEARTAGGDKPVAILIVGLPRSGTTLIEQILSAHSRVQATDELPFLEKIALELEMNGGYPARLKSMSDEERSLFRQRYVDGARTYLAAESDFFIDKYPGNFLHIGLVKRIMPESIIIDARRDPRDIAVSAYRQLFNVRNEFASSFDGVYEYYKGYRVLIDHWKSAFPAQIKSIGYEKLVTSPDTEIQALLDFCGLESEPGCFEFYKQKRAVVTPSVSNVSRPMFTSSIGQWRHYEEYAAEEMARLGTLVDHDIMPDPSLI